MDDPNVDLIGFRFGGDQGWLTVTATAPWSNAYVLCEGAHATCRPAALVRAFKTAAARAYASPHGDDS